MLGFGGDAGAGLSVGAAITTATLAGFAGSALAPIAARRVPLWVVIGGASTATAALLGVATGTGRPEWLAAAFAVLCFAGPIGDALMTAIRVELVPEEIYGRVVSASGFAAQILQPLAPLLTGLALSALPRAGVAGGLAAVFAVLAALGVLVARLARNRQSALTNSTLDSSALGSSA